MKQLVICGVFCAMAAGCGEEYEDKRVDPTTQPDFVDTSDPNVVLGQQAKEREEMKANKKKK